MTKKRSRSNVPKELMAIDVHKLMDAALSGKLADLDDTDERKTREVAFGLVHLRQLADREQPRLMKGGWAEYAASGNFAAQAILAALTSGHDHPIWEYIASLRSAKFRPQNAPPNQMDQLRRDFVVGLVLAYHEAGGARSKRKAIEAVVNSFRSSDFNLQIEVVKGWTRRPGGFARPFADQLLSDARRVNGGQPLADRVMADGREIVQGVWSVPPFPRGEI